MIISNTSKHLIMYKKIIAATAIIDVAVLFYVFERFGELCAIISMCISAMFFITIFSLITTIAKMEQLAFRDDLTGGINLQKFEMLSSNFFEKNKGDGNMLIHFDINDFKVVNDMYGFEEGNKVLCNVAKAIAQCNDGTALFSRVSKDDFVVLANFADRAEAMDMIRQFREKFYILHKHHMEQYAIVFTIGIYEIPKGETNIQEIMENAALAHKIAKKKDGQEAVFYDSSLRNRAIKDKTIENMMHSSLANGEFTVYLQPKFNLKSGAMQGAEALIRWNLPGEGVVSPIEFVPLFEKNGFIIDIDLFVLEHVCQLQRAWIDAGIQPVPISVNQSKLLISTSDYVEKVVGIVEKYSVSPSLIELELTETILHNNIELLRKTLHKLREIGFIIAIDDFGSGYSSLNLLKEINADVLKIDREFLERSEENERGEIVLSNVIRLAKELNMSVVTEGVETQKQAELLIGLSCDVAQGYLYARPMNSDDFGKRLSDKQ